MWDNREDKPSPKHPDYKCKDKDCGHAVWLEKRGNAPKPGNGKATPAQAKPRWTTTGVMEVYAGCLKVAAKAVRAQLGDEVTNAEILAAAATIFIAVSRDGPPQPKAEDA